MRHRSGQFRCRQNSFLSRETYVPKPPCINKKHQPLAETVDWHLRSLAQMQELITQDLRGMTPQDSGYQELYQRESELKILETRGKHYLELCSFVENRNITWDESHPEWAGFMQYCDVTVPEFLKNKGTTPQDAVENTEPLPPPPPDVPPPPVHAGPEALRYKQPGWSEVRLNQQIHWHWCTEYNKGTKWLFYHCMAPHTAYSRYIPTA